MSQVRAVPPWLHTRAGEVRGKMLTAFHGEFTGNQAFSSSSHLLNHYRLRGLFARSVRSWSDLLISSRLMRQILADSSLSDLQCSQSSESSSRKTTFFCCSFRHLSSRFAWLSEGIELPRTRSSARLRESV